MVRDDAETVFLEGQGAVAVEQVRLVLVDQVLDPRRTSGASTTGMP